MAREHAKRDPGAVAGAERSKCPVCGMEVDPKSLVSQFHNGRKYLFCSEHCLYLFKRNPEQYAENP